MCESQYVHTVPLIWLLSKVQLCQQLESSALSPLLLMEGQCDERGRAKAAPPAGCSLASPFPPPLPPLLFLLLLLILLLPQGLTRTDQTLRLEGQWSVPSLPCVVPPSIPSFCCSQGWMVCSSLPAAALMGPGDLSWRAW